MKTELQIVADTNIIISSQIGTPSSPSREVLRRWQNQEFGFLFSKDTAREYFYKLKEFNIPSEKIQKFMNFLRYTAVLVNIEYYHLKKYPADPDDTAFLLCAHNGDATHLVSYDSHLLDINSYFEFLICEPVPFLKELRQTLSDY